MPNEDAKAIIWLLYSRVCDLNQCHSNEPEGWTEVTLVTKNI